MCGWLWQDNVCGIAAGYLFFYGYLTRLIPSEARALLPPHPRWLRAGCPRRLFFFPLLV